MPTADSPHHLHQRKQPRQARSIALVQALKIACLRILNKDGAQAMSMARLSEVSGVGIASIYEYFPHAEAVVAAVLREHTENSREDAGSTLSLPHDTPLKEVLLRLVRRTFDKRADLVDLHGQVYGNHAAYFEVVDVALIEKILDRFSHHIKVRDTRLAALVVTNLLRDLTLTLFQDNPQYLRSPQAERIYVRMLLAVLDDPKDPA